MAPMRERRAYYEAHKDDVRDMIVTGTAKANVLGTDTINNVKRAMRIML
jgi:tryptophanyl-tRNA synthetase